MVNLTSLKRLVVVCLLVLSSSIHAKGLSLFVGAGTNFSGVGTARIGYGNWEFGKFSPRSLGLNKIFKASKSTYYTFGFGIDNTTSPSILAGAGFNFFRILGFGLRGELYSVTNYKGNLGGAATLGVSWNF